MRGRPAPLCCRRRAPALRRATSAKPVATHSAPSRSVEPATHRARRAPRGHRRGRRAADTCRRAPALPARGSRTAAPVEDLGGARHRRKRDVADEATRESRASTNASRGHAQRQARDRRGQPVMQPGSARATRGRPSRHASRSARSDTRAARTPPSRSTRHNRSFSSTTGTTKAASATHVEVLDPHAAEGARSRAGTAAGSPPAPEPSAPLRSRPARARPRSDSHW